MNVTVIMPSTIHVSLASCLWHPLHVRREGDFCPITTVATNKLFVKIDDNGDQSISETGTFWRYNPVNKCIARLVGLGL